VLYQVMQAQLSTFLAMADARAHAAPCGSSLPRHVRREFTRFMDCGILARGFCRVFCPDCGQSELVAYSCKARSVCPSCTGRRMAEVAAHLVDHVFPEVPVRQWVLSLPHRVRYLLARHPALCRDVRGIFARAVHSFYSRRANAQDHPGGRSGSVVQVQRFDSTIRLDVHFHGLFLDGVYTGFDSPGRPLAFHPAENLTDDEVDWLVRHIRALTSGHLRRRGYLDDHAALVDESADDLDEMSTHQAAAVQGLIPFGPRAGQHVPLFGEAPEGTPRRPYKRLCADYDGYSLHAAVRIAAGNTARLERIIRYIARPLLAGDRLSVASDGSIVYRFRKPWRDGKRAVVMDPMTFISRLSAQVPPPRFHVLSYYGVLAPAASCRDQIVPGHCDEQEPPRCCRGNSRAKTPTTDARPRMRPRPERLAWAELVQRVWLEDILRCCCGGRRRVLAMVCNPDSIERVLRHLGLPHAAPVRAPPRPLPASLPFSA